ncbi:hypothetical protein IGI04_039655 [Brassica rapa subsp. trilocularis]|uniref:Uncharacterized protein n=1 Tax=Brassica rapa subsp. trilocularis TaxID=1813537 RepID=A0ABQ7KP63_BRACM|nr:hypothetical protein IGI04_039655 [Brassica rapa subsp. trilocularis]
MTSAPPPDSGGTDPATKENQEGLLREKGELSPVEKQKMKEIAPKAISWVEELENKEGNSVIRGSEMSIVEKSIVEKEMEEIEEGEVVKGWSDVTPGKASKSPKLLEYGQVKIATRFDALSNVDDNGDLVERIEEVEAVPSKKSKMRELEGKA